jgi:hypothetical protein
VRASPVVWAVLLLSASAQANEAFQHDLAKRILKVGDRQTLAAGGSVFDHSITVIAAAVGKPSVLESMVVHFSGVIIVVPLDAVTAVIDPRLKDIYVISDTGVFGNYYSVHLPYGPKVLCKYGRKRYRWRAQVMVRFDNGEDGYKISEACPHAGK